jgi:carbon storage regulator CsrA
MEFFAMLVFSRKVDQAVVIGEPPNQTTLIVSKIRGEAVVLAFDAPAGVPIDRREVYERKAANYRPGRSAGPAWDPADRATLTELALELLREAAEGGPAEGGPAEGGPADDGEADTPATAGGEEPRVARPAQRGARRPPRRASRTTDGPTPAAATAPRPDPLIDGRENGNPRRHN